MARAIVSNERGLVFVRNVWGVSAEKYNNQYANRSAASRVVTPALPVTSYPYHENAPTADPIVPKESGGVNNQNSTRIDQITPQELIKGSNRGISHVRK